MNIDIINFLNYFISLFPEIQINLSMLEKIKLALGIEQYSTIIFNKLLTKFVTLDFIGGIISCLISPFRKIQIFLLGSTIYHYQRLFYHRIMIFYYTIIINAELFFIKSISIISLFYLIYLVITSQKIRLIIKYTINILNIKKLHTLQIIKIK